MGGSSSPPPRGATRLQSAESCVSLRRDFPPGPLGSQPRTHARSPRRAGSRPRSPPSPSVDLDGAPAVGVGAGRAAAATAICGEPCGARQCFKSSRRARQRRHVGAAPRAARRVAAAVQDTGGPAAVDGAALAVRARRSATGSSTTWNSRRLASDGGEQNFWAIDFDSTFSVSTYVGDRWRLRSRRGLLLLEFVVAPGCPSVTLAPCVPTHAAAGGGGGAVRRRVGRRGARRRVQARPSSSATMATPIQHLPRLWAPPAYLERAAASRRRLCRRHRRRRRQAGAPVASHRSAVARGAERRAAAGGGRGGGARARPSSSASSSAPPKQPPALFTRAGRRIVDGAASWRRWRRAARASGLTNTHGQWLWPAPRRRLRPRDPRGRRRGRRRRGRRRRRRDGAAGGAVAVARVDSRWSRS